MPCSTSTCRHISNGVFNVRQRFLARLPLAHATRNRRAFDHPDAVFITIKGYGQLQRNFSGRSALRRLAMTLSRPNQPANLLELPQGVVHRSGRRKFFRHVRLKFNDLTSRRNMLPKRVHSHSDHPKFTEIQLLGQVVGCFRSTRVCEFCGHKSTRFSPRSRMIQLSDLLDHSQRIIHFLSRLEIFEHIGI